MERSLMILVFLMACALVEESSAAMSEAQMKGAMKTLRNMCLPKSGVSKEALANMKEGQFDDEDRKLKCYMGCIMNMMQVVKNGKISMTMVKNQIMKMVDPTWGAKLVATFESCASVAGIFSKSGSIKARNAHGSSASGKERKEDNLLYCHYKKWRAT